MVDGPLWIPREINSTGSKAEFKQRLKAHEWAEGSGVNLGRLAGLWPWLKPAECPFLLRVRLVLNAASASNRAARPDGFHHYSMLRQLSHTALLCHWPGLRTKSPFITRCC